MPNATPEPSTGAQRTSLYGSPARWIGLATLASAVWHVSAFHGVRGDDAFITYRYGQNLASGLGVVFNPGERVQGFTSPGHMLVSALVYALSGAAHTPGVMSALGALAWTAEALGVFLLFERGLGRVQAAGLALLIALGAAGSAGFVVMETHFAVACVLAALCAADRERWQLAAVCAGFGVLFRPDAALPAALVLLRCVWRLRAAAWRPVLLFLLVAAPFPAFAQVYYGSALPQTALTKFQRVDLLAYLLHEWLLADQRLLWSDVPVIVVWLSWPLFAVGALRLWRRGYGYWPVYGLLHAGAYLYLRPFVQHTWHLYPWTLVYCTCFFAALAPLPPLPPLPNGSPSRVLRGLGAAACGGLLVIAAQRSAADMERVAGGYWTGQRHAVYEQVSEYLRAHARPGDVFASVEVGTIAFLTNLRAYDMGGLVTPPNRPADPRTLRFLVLDKLYLNRAPASAPVFTAQSGEFMANVYELRP